MPVPGFKHAEGTVNNAALANPWKWHDRTTAVPPGLPALCYIEVRLDDAEHSNFLLKQNVDWTMVDHWRVADVVIQTGPDPVEGIGDINSTETGSGARYNTGKPPMELVPLAAIAASFGTHVPANRALALLSIWQEGGTQDTLTEIFRELGYDGWYEAALVFDYGRKKYAEWNWAKGMPWSAVMACAARHLMQMIDGEEIDAESKLPHRGHVFCNIVMLWTYHRTYKAGDDRPASHLLKGSK